MHGKLLREITRSKGDSGSIDLTESLLKAGQGDLTLPGGWWRVKKPIKY